MYKFEPDFEQIRNLYEYGINEELRQVMIAKI